VIVSTAKSLRDRVVLTDEDIELHDSTHCETALVRAIERVFSIIFTLETLSIDNSGKPLCPVNAV